MLDENTAKNAPEGFAARCVVRAEGKELPGKFRSMLIKRYVDGLDLACTGKDELVDGIDRTLDEFAFMLVQPRMGDEAIQNYLKIKKPAPVDTQRLGDRVLELTYEMLAEKYTCYPIMSNGCVVFVLKVDLGAKSGASGGWTETYRQLEDYLASKRLFFMQNLGFIPQMIASEVTEELRDLPKTLHTTTFSCDYVFNVFPKKRVVTPLLVEERIRYQNGTHIFKPEKERRFFECVIKNDFHSAQNLMKEIMLDDRSINAVVAIRERVRDRLQWTISLLGIPGGRDSEDVVAIRELVDGANSCKSMAELRRLIEVFFTTLESYYEKNSNTGDQKIKLVTQYISENYADQDLSVNSICEVFHVSPEHLSRSFRKKTGVKLIDYIHLTRLSRAKELMQDQLGLSEISMRVGYYGEWSLARAFKRFEGMTPSEYRVNANR